MPNGRSPSILWLAAALAIAVSVVYLLTRRASASPPPPPPSGAFTNQGGHRGAKARWVLVLDLDETLVHSPNEGRAETIERPHVREFLRRAAEAFDEVAVFTAGTMDYASPILDRLDPVGRVFGRRFFRESCSIVEAPGGGGLSVVKDLRILGEVDLSRVRLVDNTPSTYAYQPRCGVPISSFYGDPADDALPQTLARLLAEVAADRA